MQQGGTTTPRRPGRRPATTRAELADVAIGLFVCHGYAATSVADIARQAGISRRTFFRYFASKTDLVWGDFDGTVARMRSELAAVPEDVPLLEALRRGLVRSNTLPTDHQPHHRQRVRLIMTEPELLAQSTLRYRRWREAVAEFAAARLGAEPDSLLPRTLGYAVLGVGLAAYEQWLADGGELTELLDAAARGLERGFAAPC